MTKRLSSWCIQNRINSNLVKSLKLPLSSVKSPSGLFNISRISFEEKSQIPYIKIHSLRHQFSCRWIEQGFDAKSFSEILGHTFVKTTLDFYVHIQAETKREYINQLTAP
ncbi:site-specific integrase [Blautia producta]|uniref:site-specific integrase n=1 Tax=Blautia producta TaxID=33035 RepID=UPI0031B5C96A